MGRGATKSQSFGSREEDGAVVPKPDLAGLREHPVMQETGRRSRCGTGSQKRSCWHQCRDGASALENPPHWHLRACRRSEDNIPVVLEGHDAEPHWVAPGLRQLSCLRGNSELPPLSATTIHLTAESCGGIRTSESILIKRPSKRPRQHVRRPRSAGARRRVLPPHRSFVGTGRVLAKALAQLPDSL